jgi:hypothetical protein
LFIAGIIGGDPKTGAGRKGKKDRPEQTREKGLRIRDASGSAAHRDLLAGPGPEVEQRGRLL